MPYNYYNNKHTVIPFFCDLTKTQTLWYKLTEFLLVQNISLEITRLKGLLINTFESHRYNILKKDFL